MSDLLEAVLRVILASPGVDIADDVLDFAETTEEPLASVEDLCREDVLLTIDPEVGEGYKI